MVGDRLRNSARKSCLCTLSEGAYMFVMVKEKSQEVGWRPRERECFLAIYLHWEKVTRSQVVRMPPLVLLDSMNRKEDR